MSVDWDEMCVNFYCLHCTLQNIQLIVITPTSECPTEMSVYPNEMSEHPNEMSVCPNVMVGVISVGWCPEERLVTGASVSSLAPVTPLQSPVSQ